MAVLGDKQDRGNGQGEESIIPGLPGLSSAQGLPRSWHTAQQAQQVLPSGQTWWGRSTNWKGRAWEGEEEGVSSQGRLSPHIPALSHHVAALHQASLRALQWAMICQSSVPFTKASS